MRRSRHWAVGLEAPWPVTSLPGGAEDTRRQALCVCWVEPQSQELLGKAFSPNPRGSGEPKLRRSAKPAPFSTLHPAPLQDTLDVVMDATGLVVR